MPRALVIAILIVSSSHLAFGCVCPDPPAVEQAVAAADLVFVGTVTALELEREYSPTVLGEVGSRAVTIVTFEVNEVWKGRVSETERVVSRLPSSTCGFKFEPGGRYIVYAKGDGPSGRYDVSKCSRTRVWTGSHEELAQLGEPVKDYGPERRERLRAKYAQ